MVSMVELMKAKGAATLQTEVPNWDLWHSNGACQQDLPFVLRDKIFNVCTF